MKNPILSNSRNFYYYLIAWAVIIIAHAIILFYFYHIPFFISLVDGVIFNILFAGMALNIWYSARYHNIGKNSFYLLLSHIITAIIFLSIWIFLSTYILKILFNYNQEYIIFLTHSFPSRIVMGVLYYAITILGYYLYIYYNSFKEKLLKESELNALIRETELSLLKSQLNPHFIFNSLNSISALTIINPTLAQSMVIKLSSFLRYALEHNKNQEISFHEELGNALLYLDIEKTRFRDRLIFSKTIEENCSDAKIPNMILQPLLENAIKHGVYENTEPVSIKMICTLENNLLHIKISNTFDPEAIIKKGKGIGIRNVKERLFLMYGKNDLFKISESNNLFEVNLYIPQQ